MYVRRTGRSQMAERAPRIVVCSHDNNLIWLLVAFERAVGQSASFLQEARTHQITSGEKPSLCSKLSHFAPFVFSTVSRQNVELAKLQYEWQPTLDPCCS